VAHGQSTTLSTHTSGIRGRGRGKSCIRSAVAPPVDQRPSACQRTDWERLTMTVSIRRMTLGSGYKYLMGSVAQSDGASQHASALTRYYAESGTPPGRFIGQGLTGLGNGV